MKSTSKREGSKRTTAENASILSRLGSANQETFHASSLSTGGGNIIYLFQVLRQKKQPQKAKQSAAIHIQTYSCWRNRALWYTSHDPKAMRDLCQLFITKATEPTGSITRPDCVQQWLKFPLLLMSCKTGGVFVALTQSPSSIQKPLKSAQRPSMTTMGF